MAVDLKRGHPGGTVSRVGTGLGIGQEAPRPGDACWLGAPWFGALAAACALLAALPARAADAVEPALDDLFGLSVSELMEVPVSTASKREEPRWRSPNVVSVISGEALRRYGHTSLAEALQTVVGLLPGFDGWRDPVGLRGEFGQGTFNSRILWLVDGHRINDGFFQSGWPGAGFPVDLTVVDHVEVVRGPGSALYGSGAFFGVVNVVTRSPAQAAGATMTLTGGGELTAPPPQAVGAQVTPLSDRRWAASVASALGGGEVLLSASARSDEGRPIWIPYFNATGAGAVAYRRDGVDADRMLLDARAGGWRLLATFARVDQGTPDANYGAMPDSPLNRSFTTAWFVELQHRLALGQGLALTSRLYLDRNSFTREWHYDGIWPLDRKDVRSAWGGLEERLDWRAGRNRLQAGVELQALRVRHHEDYPSEATAPGVPFVNDYAGTFLDYALYASDELELSERWYLTAGGRLEGNDVDGHVVTGRAALVVRPWATTVLKAQAGQGFKNTAVNFYSYHSSELGQFQFDIVPLKREQVTSWELVWSQVLDPLSLEVVLFDNQVRRLITYDGATDSYFNGPGLDTRGLEVELTASLAGRATAYGGWSWVHTENRDGTPVYNVPAWSLKAGAAARLVGQDALTAAAEAQVYGPADFVDFPAARPGVDLRQGAHAVANLNLTGRVAPLRLSWSLGVRNLLDAAFGYPVANGTRQPFPAQGRSWHGSVELRY